MTHPVDASRRPGGRAPADRPGPLSWALRATLVLLVVATLALAVLARLPSGRAAAYPRPAAPDSPTAAPAAFLLADGVGCSGTLVGPRLVLTAAHCVVEDDGGTRRPMTASFAVRGYDVDTGVAHAEVTCRVGRVWAAGRSPDTPSTRDWALLRPERCRSRDGAAVAAPGRRLGWHPVARWDGGRPHDVVYVGYPRSPLGEHGQLQRLRATAGFLPWQLRLLHPVASRRLTCTREAAVPAGGSGGGLLDRRTGELVAVSNFLADGAHACFRVVDDEVVRAVRRVNAGHWPTAR